MIKRGFDYRSYRFAQELPQPLGCSGVRGVIVRFAHSVVRVVTGLRPQELEELPLRSGVTVRSAHSDDSSTRANKRSKVSSSGKAAITPSSTEGAAITPNGAKAE